MQALQQETIQAYNRCEQQLTQLHQMQQQLAGCVPRGDLERQTHINEQMQGELYEAREQGRQLRERLERQVREIEEIDGERRQLIAQVVECQTQVTEKNRDIELHTIKIESLENIVKRREQQTHDN